jgi:hypothetical protein
VPDKIINSFEHLRVALDGKRFRITTEGNTSRHKQIFDNKIDRSLEEIQTLMTRAPAFFHKYDYSWCLDRASYTNPIEATQQLELLQILIAISEQIASGDSCGALPAYPQRLGRIAVRTLGSADFSARALSYEDYHYVIFGTSFLKSISRFVYMIITSHMKISRSRDTLAMVGIEFSRNLVVQLLEDLKSCAEYEVAKGNFFYKIDALDLDLFLGNPVGEELFDYAVWARRFVLAHEISHILHDPDVDHIRSVEREMSMDEIGMSHLANAFPKDNHIGRGPAVFSHPVRAANSRRYSSA